MKKPPFLWKIIFLIYITIILSISLTEYILIEGIPGIQYSGARRLLDTQIREELVRLSEQIEIFYSHSNGHDFDSDLLSQITSLLENRSIVFGILSQEGGEWILHSFPYTSQESRYHITMGEPENWPDTMTINNTSYIVQYSYSKSINDYIFSGIKESYIINNLAPWRNNFIIVNFILFTCILSFIFLIIQRLFVPIRTFFKRITEQYNFQVQSGPKLNDIEVLYELMNSVMRTEEERKIEFQTEIAKKTKELVQLNEELSNELKKRNIEALYQEKRTELYKLFAESAVNLSFSTFLKAFREMFHSEVAILTFLKDKKIQNIYFNSSESFRITVPYGIENQLIPNEKLFVINRISQTGIVYIDKPRLSIFGKCRLNLSVIYTAHIDQEVVALLQIGGSEKEYSRIEKHYLESIFQSIEPALVTIVLEENLQRQKRNAVLQKRTTEEQYRKIFDSSQDMIVNSAANGEITQINNAGVQLLGYMEKSELIGKNLRSFFSKPEAYDYVVSQLIHDGFVRDMEIVFSHQTGMNKVCLMSATPEYGNNGEFAQYSSSFKDITERIQLDKELWSANIELAEINQKLQDTQLQVIQNEKLASIGQLAAGVAHEINNPLGFIQSNFNSMNKYATTLFTCIEQLVHVDGEDYKEEILSDNNYDFIRNDISDLIKETGDGINRILSIVQNLKNFARSDNNNGGREIINIKEAIDTTLVIAKNEYKYHAEVINNVPEDISLNCKAGELKQVFLNLVVNSSQAIKEHLQSGGVIRISAERKKSEIWISFEDNGPGIPEEKRLTIFDPFFTTKEVGKGTGLGLSISYDIIVNKHNGKIFADDSVLGGAKFSIVLPIIQNESDNEDIGELVEM